MRDAGFRRAYPQALLSAQVRSAAAVVTGAVLLADREDWEQEALTAVWRALPRYDAARASMRTYVERVIATRLASLRQGRRWQPRFEPLEEHHSVGLGEIPMVEFRIDFRRVSASLAERDRRLAIFLADHSPTQASRALGISRSTVYEGIRRIRVAFEDAGLGPRAGRH